MKAIITTCAAVLAVAVLAAPAGAGTSYPPIAPGTGHRAAVLRRGGGHAAARHRLDPAEPVPRPEPFQLSPQRQLEQRRVQRMGAVGQRPAGLLLHARRERVRRRADHHLDGRRTPTAVSSRSPSTPPAATSSSSTQSRSRCSTRRSSAREGPRPSAPPTGTWTGRTR